jgi:hypothetical protein
LVVRLIAVLEAGGERSKFYIYLRPFR